MWGRPGSKNPANGTHLTPNSERRVNLLITKYIPAKNIPLIFTDVLLILLAIGVILLAIRKFAELKNATPKAA